MACGIGSVIVLSGAIRPGIPATIMAAAALTLVAFVFMTVAIFVDRVEMTADAVDVTRYLRTTTIRRADIASVRIDGGRRFSPAVVLRSGELVLTPQWVGTKRVAAELGIPRSMPVGVIDSPFTALDAKLDHLPDPELWDQLRSRAQVESQALDVEVRAHRWLAGTSMAVGLAVPSHLAFLPVMERRLFARRWRPVATIDEAAKAVGELVKQAVGSPPNPETWSASGSNEATTNPMTEWVTTDTPASPLTRD
jgi:hypothetical protein